MDPLCRSTRERLASEAGGIPVPEVEPRHALERGDSGRGTSDQGAAEHLADCADCRAWHDALLEARGRQVEALRGLVPRSAPADLDALVAASLEDGVREDRATAALARLLPLKAPSALDGAVVASLQAGSRQERALRHLGALERHEAPASLDVRAADALTPANGDLLPSSSSPAVLERLVREDLADLPRALSRRFLDKLTRKPAPAELAGRVRSELAAPRGRLLRPVFGSRSRIAAAGFLIVLGALGWARFGLTPDGDVDGGTVDLAGFALDVRSLSPAEAFADEAVDPLTRRLADEVSSSRLSLGPDLLGSAAPDDDPEDGSDDDDEDGGSGGGGSAPAPSGSDGGSSAGSTAPTTPNDSTMSPGPARVAHLSRELLTRMEAAPLLPVRLTRRVELYGQGQDDLELAFEELVLRDGLGGFAVQATDVAYPVMTTTEEDTFRLLQAGRQGYVERHRDFRVRDAATFLQHYSVIDLNDLVDVAGRRCVQLEVQGRLDTTISWRLAVDFQSGLVLREERRDAWGKPLMRVEVTELDTNPDLSTEVLDGGPSAWTPVDTATLAGTPLYVPTDLPLGFQLIETATQTDGLGRVWLRRLYSDGLRELFFLHELVAPAAGVLRVNHANQHRDVVNSFAVGGVQILDGELQGVRVIALGMLSEYQLLQWMSSAL